MRQTFSLVECVTEWVAATIMSDHVTNFLDDLIILVMFDATLFMNCRRSVTSVVSYVVSWLL